MRATDRDTGQTEMEVEDYYYSGGWGNPHQRGKREHGVLKGTLKTNKDYPNTLIARMKTSNIKIT